MDFDELFGLIAKAVVIAIGAVIVVACFVFIRWMLLAACAIHQ